jgi:hypothetical protein
MDVDVLAGLRFFSNRRKLEFEKKGVVVERLFARDLEHGQCGTLMHTRRSRKHRLGAAGGTPLKWLRGVAMRQMARDARAAAPTRGI